MTSILTCLLTLFFSLSIPSQAAAGYTFGAVTAKTVIGGLAGAAIGTHGIDTIQAGARQFWTGRQVDAMSSSLLQSAGLPRQTANTINVAVSVAATIGTSAANMAAATAPGITAAKSTTTALSPYRYTRAGETFQHYSYGKHAESLAGGLRPGSYGTTAEGLSRVGAQQGLALRHATPPNAVYSVTPPPGTPIRVNPITRPQFGQPGGLPEVEFVLGTPPGSVSGPTFIPRGAP